MRIATWNINGLRARLAFTLRWLAERQPDLVGLQELKLSDEEFPHGAFAEAGYRALTHGQKAWNGVAILARDPLSVETIQTGLPGQAEFGARLLSARCGDLLFTTVYCPNGKAIDHADYPKKLRWFDALLEYLENSHTPGESMVVCGDVNICPGGIDSWNEAVLAGGIFHTEQERARFRRLLDWGLEDVFRTIHPDTQAFSWWDYRGGAFHRRQGLRIDVLLATAPVMARVRAAEIDRDYRKKQDGLTPSDHAPVFADLE